MLRSLTILVIIGLLSAVYGIEIELREGKESGEKFSTLNLKGEQPVKCVKKFDEFETLYEVECIFHSKYDKKLKHFSNSYFDVRVDVSNKETSVKIQPRFNSLLFSSDKDIPTLEYFYPREELEEAKHWLMVGFQGDEPPFIKDRNIYNPKRITFPLKLQYKQLPFIGALDVDGHPIKEGNAKDVSDYMELREEFQKGHYRAVVNSSNSLLREFPDTLFRPEIILYQMRALFKLNAYQKIINISKDFLRNYSGDDAVPEVLLYTAYVHSKLGFLAYAKYYFERLFEEHKDSEFRNMGFVYYGDDRIYQGKRGDGIKLYKQALYNTKDKLIATKAAYRLGNIYLQDLKPDEAEFFLSKVVEGNGDYFNNNVPANYKLAKDLADYNKTKLSSDIMRVLLKDKTFNDLDDYEDMLKDLAVWLDMAGEVDEAYGEYARYLDTYDYGLHDKLIRTNQDKLLFQREEMNTSKRFANYNKLIETYTLESDIGKQAIYEKAKLLHDTGEHGMVLAIEDDLATAMEMFPDSKRVLESSAIKDSIKKLNIDECAKAITQIVKYKIKLPYDNDLKLYNCSMKAGKYQLAEEIARRNIEFSKETLDWVYRLSQVLIKTGEYKAFLPVSDEVISLMELDRVDKYLDIHYDRFQAFNILGDDENLIKSVNALDRYFNGTYRNLQPFKSVVTIAKKRQDDLLIEEYAERIIKIQKRLNSYIETPEIELLLITSLKHQNKIERAIEVGEELLQRDIKADQKARVHYELGSAYQNVGNSEKSKENFQKSYDSSPENVWGKLSRDYLDMYQ